MRVLMNWCAILRGLLTTHEMQPQNCPPGRWEGEAFPSAADRMGGPMDVNSPHSWVSHARGPGGLLHGSPLHLHAAGQGHCTADHCSEQLEQDRAERVPNGRGESPEQPTWVLSLGLPALRHPGFCSATAEPFGNVVFDWPRACPSSGKWNGVLGLPSLQPSAQED